MGFMMFVQFIVYIFLADKAFVVVWPSQLHKSSLSRAAGSRFNYAAEVPNVSFGGC